jgi:hypothetical protein
MKKFIKALVIFQRPEYHSVALTLKTSEQPKTSAIHKEQPYYFSLNFFEKYQPGYKGDILGSLCSSASELVETRLSSSKKSLIPLIV